LIVGLPMLVPIGRVMLWVVLFTAVVSAADYYRRFQRLLSARVTDVSVARARAEAGARKAG